RVIDISSPNDATGKKRTGKALPPEEKAAGARAKRENCGDQHRLTYVALTRAKHQTIAWWAPTDAQTKLTGLTRMLLGQPHTPADEAVDVPRDAASAIAERINSSGAGDAVELVVLDSDVAADPTDLPVLVDDAGAAPDPDALHELKLDRPLDRAGRVWSFSSLSRDLHVAVPLFQAGDPSEDHGDDRSTHDEPPGQDRADAGPDISELEPTSDHDGGWLLTSPYDRLGGGKDFGNLVHHLLELVDFTADPLEPALADLLRVPSGHPVTDVQRDELPTVLADVIRTPLGSDFHDLRLVDLAPQDRLNELGFHFSLAPESPISAGLIGSVVADHLPADDPLQRWAAALASGLSGIQLHGFLNGSIDLTLRQQVDGSTRYSVVDYKTNNLAPGIASPLLAHYRRPRLLQAMADNQYALQALIYSVALHRYLGWRLADYDPAVHLGPVGYLFVRGMVGAGTPTETVGDHTYRAGVFSWQVPHELVVAMSALFAGDRELTST
ncbi:MAG: hypothetical protein GX643_03520, partial [Acidimicrobiales bacterium]|nr:hypothetical protein [Acidimicrobiales bacterium]